MCKFDVEMRGLALILLFMFAVWSCTSPVDGELSRAEGLMEEHPDSALVLLEGIGSSSLTTDGSRALYALLLTQARDKNYIDETDDSLISVATEYFGQDDEPRRAMLSSFYHGRILMNGERYPEALCYMTRAYDGAEALGDNFWMGRAAEQMSVIYEKSFQEKTALSYSKTALKHYTLVSKKQFYNYCMYRIARLNLNLGYIDECIEYSLKVLDLLSQTPDDYLKNYVFILLSKSSFYKKDYKATLQYSDSVPDSLRSKDVLCFVNLSYLDLGLKEESDSIYRLVSKDRSRSNLPFIYEIQRQSGQYFDALNTLETILVNLDSAYNDLIKRDIEKITYELDEYRENKHNEEIKKTRTIYGYVIFAVVIFSVSFLLYYFVRNRKSRRIIEENISIAESLKDILKTREIQIAEAQNSIQSLLSIQYSRLDNLFDLYYTTHSKEKIQKRISDEVDKMISGFTDDKTVKEFENLINNHTGNILEKLRQSMPSLKREDYLLFLYSVLGFSQTAISLFLNEQSMKSIYNRKYRLKQKISLLDSKISTELAKYLN